MKVGDYVRFKTLSREIKIGRVIEIITPDKNSMEKYCVYDLDNNDATVDDYIVKSSPNIIDLIEVGDYVNGEQVSRIKQCPEYHLGDGILIFNEHNETIYSNFRTSKYYDIKSIVTKEAFESMEYKIGE